MDDIIKIPLQTFYDFYSSNLDSLHDDKIIEKANFIKDFKIKSYQDQRQKLFLRPKNLQKLHYVSSDTSTSPSMKSFKGLLNKISSSNVDALLLKIQVFIHDTQEDKSELIDTLMCFVKKDKTLIDNYYQIFLLFDKEIQQQNIKRIWNDFIENKEWDIPDKYKEHDVYAVNYNYDLFCDFKKWSSNIIGFIHFWKLYDDREKNKCISDLLVNSILDYIHNNTEYKRHMIDIFLEELYVLDYRENSGLKSIDLKRIPSSSKFKIEKLIVNE
tara:strand:+ start:3551 stop:4363 length:813 start_codon:yes stop_codon:yes gene_type:complete